MASSIDISQFFEVFFEESEELLAEMESLLLAIDVSAASKEECNAIFRTAHSIKGGAATFGLADMVAMTHIMESLLDKIRKGDMKLTEDHVGAFLKAKDILKRQLNGHQQKKPIDSEAGEDVLALLRDLSAQGMNSLGSPESMAFPDALAKHKDGQPVVEAAHCFRIELPDIAEEDCNALAAELGLMGNLGRYTLPDGTSVLKLETTKKPDDVAAVCSFLLNPQDIHITDTAVQPDAHGNSECFSLNKDESQNDKNQAYGLFEPLNLQKTEGALSVPTKENDRATSTLPSATTTAKTLPAPSIDKLGPSGALTVKQDSKYIRVNLEKVDQLINLVGELVITQTMIDQHASKPDTVNHEQLLNLFATLGRNTRDLQESVMSIRMMPMDLVFSRFPRMVRELAEKLGKKAKLITIGGATELDKGLIERIIDPLTHLVRNSIDHGLEEPHVRLANNKSEAGTITLSAIHESGNIVLQISDDGIGLDRGCIMQKAKDLGISVADEMSDEEVWQIISTPGFSTVQNVTDISGRGVGMDVVKRNIAAMGGSVDIRSTKGQGTTVTISLPLTLAILEGMLIRTGEEVYILPLLGVVESLQPVPGQIYEIAGKGMVVQVRDEYIPLIFLHELFDIQPWSHDPAMGIVVVVEAFGKKAALSVDSLVGQQQIVVKNLEANYRRIPGIAGATILGDGNVSLILDVPSLLNISGNFGSKQAISNSPSC